MDQAEILKEVVLDGGPRDEHPPGGVQAVQGLVSLILGVLQPVSLQGDELSLRPGHNVAPTVAKSYMDGKRGIVSITGPGGMGTGQGQQG